LKKTILVVGGAGYIGSHMVKKLTREGFHPIVVDDLSEGRREAVLNAPLHVIDIGNTKELEAVFRENSIEAVMHFASFIQVGESVGNPGKYYRNNVSNTLSLLDTMIKFEVKKFIFSSTAAIFGTPQYVPIDESHPKMPINPYGRSKLFVEQLLNDYETAFDLRSVCLRYFNAAGADPDGELGECHVPETHLIPLILQVASGRKDAITVYGNDYDTPDGTCIRDYIHVEDLCDAHLLALQSLMEGGRSQSFNLGNNNGYSVREVIAAVEEVTSRKIAVILGERRAGDPPRLVANSRFAKEELNWKPRFEKLEEIIKHAWKWEEQYFGNLNK
jgi:UDP-glucose 4-epimerase